MTLEELQLPSVDSLPSVRDIHAEHERWLEQMARDQRPPAAVRAPDFDYLAYVAELQAELPVEPKPAAPLATPSARSVNWEVPPPVRARPVAVPYVPIEFPKAVHRGTDSQIAKDASEERLWNMQGYK